LKTNVVKTGYTSNRIKTMEIIKFMQFILDNCTEEQINKLPHDRHGHIDIAEMMMEKVNHPLYNQFRGLRGEQMYL